MDIQSVNSGEGAANKSVSKASASTNGPEAELGASDAIFNILMTQLMGSIVQNNQQSVPDQSQVTVTDPAVSGKNESATLVEQAQIPYLPTNEQQTIDKSSSVPGVQKQTAGTSKAAPFSEGPNIDEKNKQNIPTPTLPKSVTAEITPIKAEAFSVPGENEEAPTSKKIETVGPAPVRNDATEKPGQSAPNVVPGSDKTDYNMILLQQDKDTKMAQGTSEEESPKNGQSAPMTGKTDFLSLMQQGQSSVQSSVQHQPAFTASAQNADGSSSPTPLQQHGTDLADIIDHNVSIVKDGSRLAVKLEPDGLGKLDINLSLDKGTVSAQIHVANDFTKNLLENNKQQMMNALVGEGLSVGGFSVSLNHKGARDGSAESGQGGGQNKNSTSIAPQAVGEAGRSGARGMVSIFV